MISVVCFAILESVRWVLDSVLADVELLVVASESFPLIVKYFVDLDALLLFRLKLRFWLAPLVVRHVFAGEHPHERTVVPTVRAGQPEVLTCKSLGLCKSLALI